jgi:hypothetical protein
VSESDQNPSSVIAPAPDPASADSSGEPVGIYFSDIFGVDPETLDQYGAFDVSLVNDLPLFVDPFLLFNSDNPQ